MSDDPRAMRKRLHRLRASWLAAVVVAAAIVAGLVGVRTRVECEAMDVASAKGPTAMIKAVEAPLGVVRLDCHEQAHEAPLPEPTRFDPTQTVATGGTVTGATGKVPYRGGPILPQDLEA